MIIFLIYIHYGPDKQFFKGILFCEIFFRLIVSAKIMQQKYIDILLTLLTMNQIVFIHKIKYSLLNIIKFINCVVNMHTLFGVTFVLYSCPPLICNRSLFYVGEKFHN